MKKKFSIVAVIILIVSFLSGCRSATEVTKRNYVELLGVDKNTNGYKVTMKLFEGKSEGSESTDKKTEIKNVTSEGKSLTEAISNASSEDGKDMFLGHCKIIAVGENVQNIYSDLESVTNTVKFPLYASIISCKNAEEYVNAKNATDSIDVLNQKNLIGEAPKTNLLKIFSSEKEITGFAVPYADIKDEKISFSHAMLFKDGKKAEILDNDAVKGLCFTTNQIKNITKLSVESNSKTGCIEIDKINTKINAKIENEKIHLYVKVKSKGRFVDNPEKMTLEEAQTAAENKIKQDIFSSLEQIKGSESDVICLKNIIKKKYPSYYFTYKGDSLYRNVDFIVDVKCSLDKEIKL